MSAAPLILVVGMHRSGTSLLGSILQALGIAMPGPLIPGDHHNPKGYFERSDITALQEELLIDLQRWWPSEAGTLQLPEGWLATPRAQRAAACLKQLLSADQERQSGPWAIKDPRSSLLFPLWRQVAADLDQPIKLLLAFRDPAEVVTSLITRDSASTGMTPTRAQALWIRHQQQLLVDAGDLPLHVVSYSRWFEAPEVQIQAIQQFCHPNGSDPATLEHALECIRPDYRRSQGRSDAAQLTRQTKRWHQKLEQAAAGSVQQLRHWAAKQPAPPARSQSANPSTPLDHPWRLALNALGNNNAETLHSAIQSWEQHGIPALSLAQLSRLNQPGFPGPDPSTEAGGALPPTLKLGLIGGSLEDWTSHLWIQRLPLHAEGRLQTCAPEATTQAVLHLQPLEHTAENPALLLHLSKVDRVFDPDPKQVRLLRLLGVNAELLSERNGTSGPWLDNTDVVEKAAAQLGLPNPKALVAQGNQWLCLGTNGDTKHWQMLPASLLHLPVFPPRPALSQQHAHLLAGWIHSCCSAGLKLVRLQPEASEQPLWQSLGVPMFQRPIHPEELLEELAWRCDGQPEPAAIPTPSPTSERIWEYDSNSSAEVAICISSYNYVERISEALESCHAQSLQALELVIVDDASTDDSLERCRAWLECKGDRFCRALLLKHQRNSGLAAARNTAFAAASAPWCWVLDADNQIDVQACERCLGLAKASTDRTAVIHPLIRICDDQGQQHGLVGHGHPWQREQLQAGNIVDAMALVRRSAWEEVGGYSHIPGGWEDFDFWCKLIEADWHGVLYPQPLATYTQHGSSMLQSQTNERQRKLSRLLQQRHPWLQLAFATENA